MSIDKQLDEYMDGWLSGSSNPTMKPLTRPRDEWDRGFVDGKGARLDAERKARERLTRCPRCGGDGMSHRLHPEDPDCPTCHGTGRSS